jgi:hypothetical protein
MIAEVPSELSQEIILCRHGFFKYDERMSSSQIFGAKLWQCFAFIFTSLYLIHGAAGLVSSAPLHQPLAG